MEPSEMSNEELCRYYWFGPDDDDGHLRYEVGKEIETRLRNSIPRTTPPTVEEVGEDHWCMAFDSQTLMWMHRRGGHLRRNWLEYTHWLPMPPKPKGTQDETE